ncbi:MAG: pyruvate kinase [Pontiellaceae bacterium]|jgi:pyruvate kinase|nr:pyruvate kinase [Pontiellaceae bacterium]
MNKQTKIICTLTDACCDPEFIKQLIINGMNVVRLNTAHMEIAAAEKIVANVRSVSDRVGILIDIRGAEVRTCNVAEPFHIKTGDLIEISGTGIPKNGFRVSHPEFSEEVPIDSRILIDDGLMELIVNRKAWGTLFCTAQHNGEIRNDRLVSVPGIRLNLPALTEKDAVFVDWASRSDVDFIAHSFVRCREDLSAIQTILDLRHSPVKIIAKIKSREGVDNLKSILDIAYGVMVAHSDFDAEIPAEDVSALQNNIIKTSIQRIKPVIIATPMMQSMVNNPRPTRAEISDIAHAIHNGTDAIMLSEETTLGKYPIEAVQMISTIAHTVESQKAPLLDVLPVYEQNSAVMPRNHLAKAAVSCAAALPGKAIVTNTSAGKTARICASYRGNTPVLALSEHISTVRQLSLSYGVYAARLDLSGTSDDELVRICLKKMIKEKQIAADDLIVFIGGGYIENSHHTNFVQIETPRFLFRH